MTREQWNELVRKINAAWPGSTLTPDQDLAYFDALKDLRADQVSAAILEAVRSGTPNPPGAASIRQAALTPSGATTNIEQPTRRLVVNLAPEAPTSQATFAPTASSPPAPPPASRRSAVGAFFTSALGVGLVCLLAGAGAAVGLTLLLGPDADAAYSRGVSFGQEKGYEEGDSAGYDRGYDAGRESVFGNLNGSSPVNGRFYVVKYGDDAIESWFDEPMIPGFCYRLRSGFSSDYQLQSSILC